MKTELIMGGRQSGRTTKLIEMAAESEARGEVCYIVCHSHTEAYRISQIARRRGLNIGFPLTYDEFLQRKYHAHNIHHLYIDNAEMLIQYMSTLPIAAMTIDG